MNPKLDMNLVQDFPELYKQRHQPMNETAMCWGFECGDGWAKLLRDLSEELTWIAVKDGGNIEASQVKEKFGTLRFYTNETLTSTAGRLADAAISRAERRSAHTCESCGDDGRIRSRGWVKTLCNQCAYKQKYPLAQWEADTIHVTDHVTEKERGA